VSKIVDYETSIVLFEISDKWQISAYEVARTLIPTQEYFETVWPTVAEFTPDDSKEKVKSEFYFLMVFAYDLAIYLTLDGGEQAAVREEYYRFLDENNPEIVNDILERTKMYVEAANNPHPEYGMSYAVGKRFVEVCDIADIAILTAAGETFQNLLKSGKNFLDEVTKKFKIVLSER
jgi:hypothetical protein